MSNRFVHETLPGRVVFSRGAARRELPKEIDRLGWQRVMIVMTANEVELATELTAAFADRIAVRFDHVLPHVPHEIAVEARAAADEHAVDGVVSIGGGSTTGTAKIVALTSHLPVLAVPTTYAGSEMTPVWGMTTDRRKETGRALQVQPQTVIYDPDLVESMPFELAVASALNALAHCLESVWVDSATPVTTAVALEGVRAIRSGLERLVVDPSEASDDLLLGAYLAGSAFAVTGSGLHHKLCHALGGAFDLPHAQTHATVLPHVFELNEPALGPVGERLSEVLGGTPASAALRTLYDLVNATSAATPLHLTPAQVDEVADLVEAKLPIGNPVPVDRAAVVGILSAAFLAG